MKLSIITINYNNKAGLEKTIESVLSQTWRDFEWIIIDGGSTDGSREIIESLNANPNANLSYWCSEPDEGVYNAMNKGITKASGEYMNFMNSGDCFYDVDTLEKVFSEKLTGDVVYGDWVREYTGHMEYISAPQQGLSSLLYFMNICHQAMFIRAELLKYNGYDESYKIVADWKKWQDMASEGRTFQYIPYTICFFEAESGLSDQTTEHHSKEMDRLICTMPQVIQRNVTNKVKLTLLENCPLAQKVLEIETKGRSWRTKIIHIALFLAKI